MRGPRRRGALPLGPLHLAGSTRAVPSLDAWATIAGLAASTTKLELGTLVSPATFRHPSVLARSAATADEISGGRVTLGMGAGWMEREHDAYGFEFANDARAGRAARRAARDRARPPPRGPRRLQGTYYQLEDAPGLGRPELPILVGGSAKPGTTSPRSGSPTNTTRCSARSTRRGNASRRSTKPASSGGRDPSTLRYSLMAPCVIGRDEQEVSESARRIGARFGRSPEEVLERNRAHGPVGTIDQAVERLKADRRDRLRARHAPASRARRPRHGGPDRARARARRRVAARCAARSNGSSRTSRTDRGW